MRKVLICILAVLTVLSLAACQKQEEVKPSDNNVETNVIENVQDEPKKLTNEEMYAGIIEDYKKAMDEIDLDDFDSIDALTVKYDYVNVWLLEHVARYAEEGVKLTYSYYDIDKNGIDELVVGASGSMAAIYSYDLNANQPAKVFYQTVLERGNLDVYDNGIILSSGSGGAALHYYEFGKIVDGTSYEMLEAVDEEYRESGEISYKDAVTKEELNYNSANEMFDKYIPNSKPIDNSNYIEI